MVEGNIHTYGKLYIQVEKVNTFSFPNLLNTAVDTTPQISVIGSKSIVNSSTTPIRYTSRLINYFRFC